MIPVSFVARCGGITARFSVHRVPLAVFDAEFTLELRQNSVDFHLAADPAEQVVTGRHVDQFLVKTSIGTHRLWLLLPTSKAFAAYTVMGAFNS